MLALDVLMLSEPLGLLAVLPLVPPWLREFVPAFKATRILAARPAASRGQGACSRASSLSTPPWTAGLS